MKLLRWLIPFLLIASPAIAQWQVTLGNVPIGRGAGVTGFSSAAPTGTGNVVFSAGPTFTGTITAAAANYSGTVGLGSFSSWDSTNNRLVIRKDNSSAFPVQGATTGVSIFGPDPGESRFDTIAMDSDGVFFCGRVNGTWAAPTAALDGEQICGLTGGSTDPAHPTAIQQGGYIGGFARGNWTNTSHGWFWRVGVIASGTISPLVTAATFSDVGGLSVGPANRFAAVGIIDADNGFTVGGAAATAGNVLRGDGTKFVSSTVGVADITGFGTGVATFLATPSSANLASAVTGETGSGALVFGTSPALTTPDLGTPSAVALNNATFPASGTTTTTAACTGGGTVSAGATINWIFKVYGKMVWAQASVTPTHTCGTSVSLPLPTGASTARMNQIMSGMVGNGLGSQRGWIASGATTAECTLASSGATCASATAINLNGWYEIN